MDLSIRLQAVADLVTAGLKFADIGTDHAYIPIYLVKNGDNPGAVAADINEGPLERARRNVEENGLGEKILLRISDGFSAFAPGEVESAVLAGMGGALMIRILKEGEAVVNSLRECILQPQSEIEKVRTFLLKEGFLFIEENMVLDDGKFYPMMKVIPPGTFRNDSSSYNREENIQNKTVELRYGRLLLTEKNPVLYEYLKREIRIKKEILSGLENRSGEGASRRRRELLDELECAEKGMKYYAL